LKDINPREKLILSVLAVTVLFFGIWPAPLLDIMHPSIEHLFEHIMQSKAGQ